MRATADLGIRRPLLTFRTATVKYAPLLAVAFLAACTGDDDGDVIDLTPETLAGTYDLSTYTSSTTVTLEEDGERSETFAEITYLDGDAVIEYRADGTYEARGTANYRYLLRNDFLTDTLALSLPHEGSGEYEIVDGELRGVNTGTVDPELEALGVAVDAFDTDLTDRALTVTADVSQAIELTDFTYEYRLEFDAVYERQ